jgi:biopolymer transport protein ExbD
MDAAIDITSLIDAAFILIIFLLISTTFKKKEHGFRIALPTAAHEELIVQVEQTSVYVTRDGALYLLRVGGADLEAAEAAARQGEPITVEGLRAALARMVEEDSEASISILAQKDTDYQRIVSVLSEIRQAGLRQVQLPYEYAGPPPEAAPAAP